MRFTALDLLTAGGAKPYILFIAEVPDCTADNVPPMLDLSISVYSSDVELQVALSDAHTSGTDYAYAVIHLLDAAGHCRFDFGSSLSRRDIVHVVAEMVSNSAHRWLEHQMSAPNLSIVLRKPSDLIV